MREDIRSKKACSEGISSGGEALASFLHRRTGAQDDINPERNSIALDQYHTHTSPVSDTLLYHGLYAMSLDSNLTGSPQILLSTFAEKCQFHQGHIRCGVILDSSIPTSVTDFEARVKWVKELDASSRCSIKAWSITSDSMLKQKVQEIFTSRARQVFTGMQIVPGVLANSDFRNSCEDSCWSMKPRERETEDSASWMGHASVKFRAARHICETHPSNTRVVFDYSVNGTQLVEPVVKDALKIASLDTETQWKIWTETKMQANQIAEEHFFAQLTDRLTHAFAAHHLSLFDPKSHGNQGLPECNGEDCSSSHPRRNERG